MSGIALINAQVHTGRDTAMQTGGETRRDLAVHLADSKIVAVVPPADLPADARRINLDGFHIAPGFVDLQVNGGGGVLFNDDPSTGALASIAAAHRRFGTAALLATVITDRFTVMQAAAQAVVAARAAGNRTIAGIHLEGPHLNPAKPGIHDPALMSPFDPRLPALVRTVAAAGAAVLVTLAPEMVDDADIAALVDAGARVSAGHSLATPERLAAAMARGLAGATHLYNAMGGASARAPGLIGAVLAEPKVTAGLIADGHHVADEMLRVAYVAKGVDGLMLVTDAMQPVGTDMTAFEVAGQRITVRDGLAANADGTIGGSVLDMMGAVRHMVTRAGVPLDDALAMAAATPARFMGLDRRYGRIAPGYCADLAVFDDDLQPVAVPGL